MTWTCVNNNNTKAVDLHSYALSAVAKLTLDFSAEVVIILFALV